MCGVLFIAVVPQSVWVPDISLYSDKSDKFWFKVGRSRIIFTLRKQQFFIKKIDVVCTPLSSAQILKGFGFGSV